MEEPVWSLDPNGARVRVPRTVRDLHNGVTFLETRPGQVDGALRLAEKTLEDIQGYFGKPSGQRVRFEAEATTERQTVNPLQPTVSLPFGDQSFLHKCLQVAFPMLAWLIAVRICMPLAEGSDAWVSAMRLPEALKVFMVFGRILLPFGAVAVGYAVLKRWLFRRWGFRPFGMLESTFAVALIGGGGAFAVAIAKQAAEMNELGDMAAWLFGRTPLEGCTRGIALLGGWILVTFPVEKWLSSQRARRRDLPPPQLRGAN